MAVAARRSFHQGQPHARRVAVGRRAGKRRKVQPPPVTVRSFGKTLLQAFLQGARRGRRRKG